MTKSSNRSSRRSNGPKGGTLTKVDGETASVAPEGGVAETTAESATAEMDAIDARDAEIDAETATIEQSDELAAEIAAEGQVPEHTDEHTDEQPVESESQPEPETGAESPVDDQTTGDADPSAESPAPESTAAAAPADPFADLPMSKIEDYEFRDLGEAQTSNPRKYEAVQTAALAAKLPIKKDWKHATAMVTSGRVKREFRPGSVYGTIDQIVSQYGRAGVPAYVLVTLVRQRQIGNKRSHYCTELPPIGWGEGWIDTFISKGHGKVMEKKAPPITAEEVTEIVEAEAEAERQAA